MLAALTRTRTAGRRDAIFNLLDPLIGLVSAAAFGRSFEGEVAGGDITKKKSAPAIWDRRWSSVISTTCPGRRCGCRPTSTSSF